MKKRIVCIMLTLAMCLSMVASINVIAATSGGQNTKTIFVETKADWSKPGSESITLKQDKATYTYEEWSLFKGWVTKKGSIYPTYNITIRNNTTGKTTTKTWKSKSIKLNLDRNCKYSITVSYDNTSTWLRSNCNSGKYTKTPYWYVSKVHKVCNYY